jgi:hypothetical protein
MDKLPSYTLHKVVQAARITAVGAIPEDGNRLVRIVLALPGGVAKEITVVADFIQRHNPQVGGYMVSEHGIFTYCPAAVFEVSASAGDEILLLETRLQARTREVDEYRLRIGQLEEALRQSGLKP